VPVTRVTVVASASGDEGDGAGPFGLREVEIDAEPDTGVPVEIRGRARPFGLVRIRLVRAELR
jgi:hypothetical protein